MYYISILYCIYWYVCFLDLKKNNLLLYVIFIFVFDGINVSFNNIFKRFYICDDCGICIKKLKLKKKIWNWDF